MCGFLSCCWSFFLVRGLFSYHWNCFLFDILIITHLLNHLFISWLEYAWTREMKCNLAKPKSLAAYCKKVKPHSCTHTIYLSEPHSKLKFSMRSIIKESNFFISSVLRWFLKLFTPDNYFLFGVIVAIFFCLFFVDPEMQKHIEKTLYSGHASYKVSLSVCLLVRMEQSNKLWSNFSPSIFYFNIMLFGKKKSN